MLNKQAYLTHVRQQTEVLFQIFMQGKQENRTTNNTRNLFYFILFYYQKHDPSAPSCPVLWLQKLKILTYLHFQQ